MPYFTPEWLRTLKIGLAVAFAWGALVALSGKIDFRHFRPATQADWIVTK